MVDPLHPDAVEAARDLGSSVGRAVVDDHQLELGIIELAAMDETLLDRLGGVVGADHHR